MHSLKSNSLKDLKLLMGEERVYVVSEKDYTSETTDILAAFKTIVSAQKFAKERALKARRHSEYLQEQYASYALLDSDDNETFAFVIEEIQLNA